MICCIGASSGNSGLGCTGYDAPIGSLERQLLRRSIQIHQNLYRSFGLSHEHVRKCGSLVVAWTEEELVKLEEVLKENIQSGDDDVQILTREELRDLEPSLCHEALGAVYLPNEAVVEPWLVPIAYAEDARRRGVQTLTGMRVVDADFSSESKSWRVTALSSNDRSVGRSVGGDLLAAPPPHSPGHPHHDPTPSPKLFEARVVINCAGLYGDEIEKIRIKHLPPACHASCSPPPHPSRAPFEITPRKGEFVVFSAPKAFASDTNQSAASLAPRFIIEPVASQFTKGVIVWTTVYGNVVVGPTAVDVQSKEDRSTDPAVIAKLREYGEKVIPALRHATVLGTYSGLRPASQFRDYQIYATPALQWITVGGIRSTGLTASSGIGEYVGELYAAVRHSFDPTFAVKPPAHGDTRLARSPDGLAGVSESARNPIEKSAVANTPAKIPSIADLSRDYMSRNVPGQPGCVEVFGRLHRVTHPISSFGMESHVNPEQKNAETNRKGPKR